MNYSFTKIWFLAISVYTLVTCLYVITHTDSTKRITEVVYAGTHHSMNFTDPSLALKVLEEFDRYEPLVFTQEEEIESYRKTYGKPALGLIYEEDYCERHRAYFVNNTEKLLREQVYFTDHASVSWLRKTLFPATGRDVQPKVGRDMDDDLKDAKINKISPEVNIFYGDIVWYFRMDQGKHFGCFSQLSNYIPGHSLLYRKDQIVTAFSDYSQQFVDRPQCFDAISYYPQSWLMTEKDQCEKFFEKFNSPKYKEIKAQKGIVYIKKIGAGVHGGRGVFPVDPEEEKSIRQLYDDGKLCGEVTKNYVMQDFIANPMLIHGHKFDFRVFLLIASTNPIIAYYGDGYLRASLKPYDPNSTDKTVMLTNPQLVDSSIMAGGEALGMTKQELLELQSWTLDQLEEYLVRIGRVQDPNWLNNKLKPEFQKALIHLVRMTQHVFAKTTNTYGFFGVDFMLDDELNLWFIEANSKPGFTAFLQKKKDLLFKMWKGQFEIVFNLLRSRLKRVIIFVNNMIEKEQVTRNADGSVAFKNLEAHREEWKKINMNYFEKEYEVNPDGFVKIIDETLPENKYMGFVDPECY